ncbi:MAG: hydroxymethylbilane synthase [Acidobacteriaceae bacterium]
MIRIGSRGSALARWQAEHVAKKLRELGQDVAIEILVTTGDRMQHAPFLQVGAKGMFTREIEEALAEGRIDLAVHSLKDLPTEMPKQFAIAAVPRRADARDAFVSVQYEEFSALPQHAVIGTSSLRRQAQLRALRPDLKVCELRGNVDTRLRKLQAGQYDAIVLAAAGLERLQQMQWVRERFTPRQMCPAAGQGALAVECRADDDATRAMVATLDHAPTRFAVTVERTALARLEGGCQLPVGVHCEAADGGWPITAMVASPDGSTIVWEEMRLDGAELSDAQARDAGARMSDRLLRRGAAGLLGSVPVTAREENFLA